MKTICLFAGYDKNENIDDYVIYYIKKLSEISDVYYYGDFIANDGELLKLKKYTKKSFAKRHGRYDYGSWDELIKNIGWDVIQQYDQLILANDSCFGPLYPFQEVFKYMEKEKCDFWGLSCGKGYHIHIQSYFLVFRKSILNSDCIPKFLSNVKKQSSLKDVCELYEDQFTFYLKKNGFSYASYIPYGEFKIHPYYETWNCIREKRFPLLKVKVFDGVVGYDSVKSWKKFINQYTDYDVNLIINNLHSRGYKDREIDLAVQHWQKIHPVKNNFGKAKSLAKRVIKKIVSPFWNIYTRRFEQRFFENRLFLQTKFDDLENKIQGLEKKIKFYPNIMDNLNDGNDIGLFLQKYGIIETKKLELQTKTTLPPNHVKTKKQLLTDDMVIDYSKIHFFIDLIKNIPMFRKSEKLNVLLCGDVVENIAMDFSFNYCNVTLLNNNSIREKTVEKEILKDNIYTCDLTSNFSFYNNDVRAFFDIILVNTFYDQIKSGELLNILYNISSNMIDESILIISIPHGSQVMDDFASILNEVEMYVNYEYQGLLEKCFQNMNRCNCFVVMKKR